MEGEFGDRFLLQFLELPVLLDWLDVVSGVQTTVQCDFKLALEHACYSETLKCDLCLASTFGCACLF